MIDEFHMDAWIEYDGLHSHYWLSGVATKQPAQYWDISHVTMFHSLEYLKQIANPNETESPLRLEMECRLIQQADCIIASTNDERLQMIRHCAATTGKVQVVPCGGDLKRFVPNDQQQP